MNQLRGKIDDIVAVIRQRISAQPRVGMILGSGLGGLANRIEDATIIDYADLPHWPRSTAVGHRGRLVLGRLAGSDVVAMQGRFHAYEGYSLADITLPVRVMREMGATLLVVSNAAGGLNPLFAAGDVMVIDDQINLMFRNPLVGMNDDSLGPRFPDMFQPYDRELAEQAIDLARHEGFACHRGVYVGMLGPTYETRAEYRMARQLGGDAVGMSTVPEVIAAVHAGMRMLGLSAIANVAVPDRLDTTSGDEVVAQAQIAGDTLAKIVLEVVRKQAGG